MRLERCWLRPGAQLADEAVRLGERVAHYSAAGVPGYAPSDRMHLGHHPLVLMPEAKCQRGDQCAVGERDQAASRLVLGAGPLVKAIG